MEKKLINGFEHLSYSRPDVSLEELSQNARTFYHEMNQRQTVREFDTRPFAKKKMLPRSSGF